MTDDLDSPNGERRMVLTVPHRDRISEGALLASMRNDGGMLHAFVDESERNESHYFLGATICTEPQRDALSLELDAVMEKYQRSFPTLHAGVEYHGSTMMRAEEEPWRSIPIRARFALYKDAFIAIEAVGVKIYLEGIDIEAQLRRGYPKPTPARELAFSHLFERINSCGRPDEQIQVHADQHHTSEISRSNFSRYQIFGTYGYRSSQLKNIHPDIKFIDSHTSRPLQAADLVTYIYNRRETVTETNPKAAKAKEDLWATIEPATIYPRGRARIWP